MAAGSSSSVGGDGLSLLPHCVPYFTGYAIDLGSLVLDVNKRRQILLDLCTVLILEIQQWYQSLHTCRSRSGEKDSSANRKQIKRKRSISNQIEQQTLTLEQRAVGSDLHRPTAGRPRAGQIRAARFVGARDRTLRRSQPGRRGARARARKQGAIHGELDGGALTHRRARTPASKPRWRRFVLSSAAAMAIASAPWLPLRLVEREGGGRKSR